MNAFTETVVIPVGLFNKADLLRLEFINDGRTDSFASVIEGYRRNVSVRGSSLVPVFDFGGVSTQLAIGKISTIRFDVEGAELEVLEGLAPAIASSRPAIIVEILPAYSAGNTARLERQSRIEKLMSGLGYRITRVKKASEGGFARLEAIDKIGIHDDLGMCGYVMTPR